MSFKFPKGCKAIIDVTKAPYFADPTGKRDSTEALKKAVDDVLSAYEKAFYETKEKLTAVRNKFLSVFDELKDREGEKICIISAFGDVETVAQRISNAVDEIIA